MRWTGTTTLMSDGGAGDLWAAVERELEQLRRMAAEGLDAGVGYIAAGRSDERRELGAFRGQQLEGRVADGASRDVDLS